MTIDKIPLYIATGFKDKNWFAECEALFVEIYGREKLKLVAQLFAATSQASSLKSNIQQFRKALNQLEKGPAVYWVPTYYYKATRADKRW